MGVILLPEDLEPFASIEAGKVQAMIDDAEALAMLAAPCISDPDFLNNQGLLGAVKAVLRGAILRWNDAGSGAVTQTGAGSFQQSIDTRTTRRSMFWPSEIDQLRGICATFNEVQSSGAFAIDMAPRFGSAHLPWCAGNMGALYCSCGVDIAGRPIFELGQD